MKTIHFIILILLAALQFSCSNQWHAGDTNPPSGYLNTTFLKAAYFVGLLDLVDTNPPVPPEINEFKDIEYKNIDGKSLKLDVYRLKNLQTPAPVLIFIHGGGWRKGKKEDYLKYLLDFAQRGYITATISYRLVPGFPFPAAVEDVKCAVRWIRFHAVEYGIDPEKIAVIGGSAGGHLSLMIGYTDDDSKFDNDCPVDSVSSRVQAVVNLYGPVDLTTEYARNHPTTKAFLATTYAENPAIFEKASPKHYISSDDPPTLTFQGVLDELVPVSQADSLHQWLQHAGVESEYHRLDGWPHTMDLAKPVNDYCQYHMMKFFEKHVPVSKQK